MFCCEKMNYYVRLAEDKIISYLEKFDEYGIPVPDGGSAYILISHCPWCGSKLPDTKRHKWFDELESLGFENPYDDEKIPVEYTTSAWFLEKEYSGNNLKQDCSLNCVMRLKGKPLIKHCAQVLISTVFR